MNGEDPEEREASSVRIDAHCHALQEGWVGEPWWQAVSAFGAHALPGVTPQVLREAILPSYFDADGSMELGSLEAAELDLAVMFPHDWTTEEHLGPAPVGWSEQNSWYRDLARAHPGRIRWGFGVDPGHEGALEAFERAVREEGAICLKLHPSNGFFLNDPVVYPFMETARSLDVPVVFHTGPSLGPLYSRWSEPRLLDEVAADFPDVRIQAAHTGNAAWRECLAVASVKTNVYCDLSGWQIRFLRNPGRFHADVREVIDAVGVERVMWGTDAPYYRALVSDGEYLRSLTEAPAGLFTDEEIAWMAGRAAEEFFALG